MIGVFDSGVGGLTVVKEVFKKLPSYDILYFADLARSPYGTKSKSSIENFSLKITDFLIKKGAKIIIVACNTASAQAFTMLKKNFPIPIFDVITPAVDEAIRSTKNKRIGIIGTRGTIQSKAYEAVFKKNNSNIQIYLKDCPLLVPLIEEGFAKRLETKRIIRYYLRDLKNRNIDTLILGCTHYPIIKNIIGEVLGKKVILIDSSKVVCKVAQVVKGDKKLDRILSKNSKHIYFASDVPNNFKEIAERFLGKKISNPTLYDF